MHINIRDVRVRSVGLSQILVSQVKSGCQMGKRVVEIGKGGSLRVCRAGNLMLCSLASSALPYLGAKAFVRYICQLMLLHCESSIFSKCIVHGDNGCFSTLARYRPTLPHVPREVHQVYQISRVCPKRPLGGSTNSLLRPGPPPLRD